MPKSYSPREKQHIIETLKKESKILFSQYGIKKTTVDEIVKRARIPKGTFYLFYPSKELLLFDVIMEEQERIQTSLITAVQEMGADISPEKFSDLFYSMFKSTTESFLFPLFTGGEYELLLRRLPGDALEKNIHDDDKSIETLIRMIPHAESKNIQAFSGAFRGIVLMALHQKEIGETVYQDSVKLLIGSLVAQLFEEKT